jgi:hypothetical protein
MHTQYALLVAIVLAICPSGAETSLRSGVVVQVLDSLTGQSVDSAKVVMTATLETLERQKQRGVGQDQLITLQPQGAGNFRASDVEAGLYAVIVVADGYGNELTAVEIEDEATARAVVRLTKTGRVRGSVTDNVGNPIQNARINVVYVDADLIGIVDGMVNVPGYLAPSTETDPNGQFVIGNKLMTDKPFVLEAASENFLPAFSEVFRCTDDQTVVADIVLSTGGVTLRGVVTDEVGNSLAGVRIGLRARPTDQGMPPLTAVRTFAHSSSRRLSQSTQSSEDGTFSMSNLFPGVAEIGVSAPGFVSTRQSIVLTAPETVLRLTMKKHQ